MNSPAEIIRSCLLDMHLVLSPEPIGDFQQPGDNTTICYVGSMPDNDDQLVAIYDMRGAVFGRGMRHNNEPGRLLIHPSVRVVVRSLTYTGYDLVNTIANGIMAIGVRTTNIAGTDYPVQNVYRIGGIMSLGEETGRQRSLFTFDARLVMQDQAGAVG